MSHDIRLVRPCTWDTIGLISSVSTIGLIFSVSPKSHVQIFLQIRELPMGSSVSGILTILFMDTLEKKAVT